MVRHITVCYPSVEYDRGLDLFPLFLDFDMNSFLPRGILAKIDLLNTGKISETINKIDKPKEIVYMLKSGLCFDKGFFLIDFKDFTQKMYNYINLLSEFEHEYLYFEKNDFLDFDLVSRKLNKIIFVTEFV